MSVKFTWHGDKLKKLEHDGAAKGLLGAANLLKERSQRVVPVAEDGGHLMRSAVASVDDKALMSGVSYDTSWADKPYAIAQHENLEYRHSAGRTAKYLEQPLMSSVEEYLGLIARAIKRSTGA